MTDPSHAHDDSPAEQQAHALHVSPASNSRAAPPRRQAAFTLMEIMVVIAIIGLIATFVAPNILNRMTEAEIEGTRVKMANLKGVISDYRRHHGRIPDSLEDLLEPSEKNLGEAYIEKEDQITDAWGQFFEYNKIDSRKFEILSFGPDGIEGGEGPDADISSLDGSISN